MREGVNVISFEKNERGVWTQKRFLIMIMFKSARGPECYCSCSFEKCGREAWRVEVDDDNNVQSL